MDALIGREGPPLNTAMAAGAAAASQSPPPSALLSAGGGHHHSSSSISSNGSDSALSTSSSLSPSSRAPGSPDGLSSVSAGSSPFLHLVKDQYGNYVCQRMLEDASSPAERAALISRMRHNGGAQLRRIPYGKHITAKIEKLTGQPFMP